MNKILLIIIFIIIITGLFLFYPKNNQLVEQNNMETKKAIIETNLGNITLELLPSQAPKTVENFITLAQQGFYDGTRFHRVIKDFMIQGGDPLSKDLSQIELWGTGGPGYVFEDEINNVSLEQGVIAMANAGPNTNGSQFFIITAEETPWLQGKHTGFGKVIEGMEIVFDIENTETEINDRPAKDIIIQKIIIN